MVHPASETDETLLESCQITFLRRSGPGGQHRNKTETAVIIEHRPSGLRGEANERRSQAENRRLALFRLRLFLATTIREPSIVNDDSGISDLWRSRSKNERLSISAEHTDFPSILAEALDCIADCEFQLDVAALRLLVSSSQIVKLLKQHRPAFEMVNRERLVRNLGILK
jgi:RF-1 domain